MNDALFALYLAAGLAVGLVAHEHARALTADRLGDPSPRRFRWLGLDPRPKADPFGSMILPLLILVPWAAGVWFSPPFAYAKPMPFEPSYLRRRERDARLVALAGPLANLAVALVAGLSIRAGIRGEAGLLALAFVYANATMFVFNLIPIPGLDGSKLLAPYLPPRARETYRNADHFLPLFMLVVYFVFVSALLPIVQGLSNVACRAVAGIDCIG